MVAVQPSQQAELFYDFLTEYTDFFQSMEQFEQHKLSILLSGDLPEIENTLSAAQANAKKLENLEQKRIRMQEEAGLGALSLSQLAESVEGERGNRMQHQLRRLTSSVYNIRFYNQKAMEVAEGNLRRFGAVHAAPELPGYGSPGHPRPEAAAPSRLEVKA